MNDPLRLLLVHDEMADLGRVHDALAADMPGVQVVSVRSQEDLVRELAEVEFDLVVTRDHLSWTNGLRVLEAVRSLEAQRPVILLATASGVDMIDEGLRRGLDGAFLTLSATLSGLAGAVAQVLEGRGRPRAPEPLPSGIAPQALVLQEACSVTGGDFFRTLVRRLAGVLQVHRAFVAERMGEESGRVRLLAVWSEGDFEQGIEYDVAGTPCEAVLAGRRVHYESKVQSLFPGDTWLRTHGVEGYYAEPVFDRAGNVLGHFGATSRRALEVDPSLRPLLDLLRARTAGELMRLKQEERLSYLAHHDVLTGLPNRLLFVDRLNQAMARANWHGVLVSVLLCDLDRFKVVSDALTQPTVDRLIQSVGERLKGCVRDGDTVARLGGKEFGLLLVDVAAADHIPPIARKILRTFQEPFSVEDQRMLLGVNIGISLYPGDGEEAETLLRCAEAATLTAASDRSNQYRFFTGAMNTKAAARLKLEESLRRAIERREFRLHYQPQVDLVSGRTTGVEALIRWESPERGLVYPKEFIPLLEETGLIVPVGEWVLRTACAQKEAWRRSGTEFARLSVNLSPRQLNDPSLIATVSRIVEETGIDPRSVELEITESMIQDAASAASILRRISSMGVTLAIDDFGTGYSSLSYLKTFPVDTLKIDQSFVRDITTDANDAAIAKAIIAMAHSLQMKVIAEGVETDEQLAFLSAQECDEIQGYLFARPVAASELRTVLPRDRMH